jgi:hypothetical protein
MSRKLAILLLLALVGMVAGPAMADTVTTYVGTYLGTGTYSGDVTSASPDSWNNPANWSWSANAPGGIGSPFQGSWQGSSSEFQQLVFGAGAGTECTIPGSAYIGCDVITFTGSSNFTVNVGDDSAGTLTYGYMYRAPYVINVLTPITVTEMAGFGVASNRNDSTGGFVNGGGGPGALTINAVVGSTLNANSTFNNLGVTVNGGGVVNMAAGSTPSLVINDHSTLNESPSPFLYYGGMSLGAISGNGNFSYTGSGGSDGGCAITGAGYALTGKMTVNNGWIGLTGPISGLNLTVGNTGAFAANGNTITGGTISGGGQGMGGNPGGFQFFSTVPNQYNSNPGTATLAGSNIVPTDVLNVYGSLVLAKSGLTNGQMTFAVNGAGGGTPVAGTDYTQLHMSGAYVGGPNYWDTDPNTCRITSGSSPGNALADTNLVVNIKPGLEPLNALERTVRHGHDSVERHDDHRQERRQQCHRPGPDLGHRFRQGHVRRRRRDGQLRQRCEWQGHYHPDQHLVQPDAGRRYQQRRPGRCGRL